jgi:hypothetical protein
MLTAKSLFEGSIEAQAYLARCRNNLQNLVLYPEENFEQIQDVSLGAVGVDLQGEVVTLEQLQRIVERVQEGPFWTTLYHDPTIHPIGRILVAKLFNTPSGASFVAALVGIYDRAKLQRLSGKLDASWKADLRPITADSGRLAYLSFNPFELPRSLIQDLISDAPEIVDCRIFEERRKSAESTIALLRLVIPAGFVFGVVKKIGEKTVDLTMESLFTWLKEKVVKVVGAWSRENNRTTMLVLETAINGCIVEFVTSLGDERDRVEAASTVYTAFAESISIVQQLSSYEPSRLVLEYDEDRKRWIPLYLVTRHGVFTDHPYLEAIRARGLSLASRMVELTATSEPGVIDPSPLSLQVEGSGASKDCHTLPRA